MIIMMAVVQAVSVSVRMVNDVFGACMTTCNVWRCVQDGGDIFSYRDEVTVVTSNNFIGNTAQVCHGDGRAWC